VLLLYNGLRDRAVAVRRGGNLLIYPNFVYEPQPPKARTITRMVGVVC